MTGLVLHRHEDRVVATAERPAWQPLAAILNDFSNPRIARVLVDQLRAGEDGRRTRIEWHSSDGRHTLVITGDRMVTGRQRGDGEPGSSNTRHSIDRQQGLDSIRRWVSAVLGTADDEGLQPVAGGRP